MKDLETVIPNKQVLIVDNPTYNIVKFKVTVYDRIAVTWKVLSHIFNDFIVVFVGTSKFFPSFSIFDLRLLSFNAAKSVAMSSVEVRLFSISCQTNGVWVQRMKPGKGFYDREPAEYANCQQDIGKVLGRWRQLTPVVSPTVTSLQGQGL